MTTWKKTLANQLVVTWNKQAGASSSQYSPLWLLDHQAANWHAQTKQKIRPASDLPAQAPEIKNVALLDKDHVRVEFANTAAIEVDLNASKMRVRSNRAGLPSKTAWKTLDEIPSSNYFNPMEGRGSNGKMLEDLCKFGLHLVRGMPNDSESTERFIRATLGPPRETLYGGMWDTAPRKENVNDTAYTFDALDPHTDCCYLIDSPGLQCFNCVAQDGGEGGGQTRLVDSAHVLRELREKAPATYEYFATKRFAFHHTEEGLHALHYAPVIQLQDDGEVIQFRYNEYDLAPLPHDLEGGVDAFYAHNRVLVAAIKQSEFRIKLQVGEMLVLDNHRVLHGRSAFTGYRNLIGCYVGADDWMMRARAHFK